MVFIISKCRSFYPSDLICRTELELKAVEDSVTQRHIPEERSPQPHRHEYKQDALIYCSSLYLTMAPQLRSVNRVKCEDHCGKGAMYKAAVVAIFYEIILEFSRKKDTRVRQNKLARIHDQ